MTKTISHEFVDYIPDHLDEGTVYVSIDFSTAVHKCCCGCGREVVTPLGPDQWELTYNGVSVSLSPSIGNWSFPCQSHYWITRGTVRWAPRWSHRRIDAARDRQSRIPSGSREHAVSTSADSHPEDRPDGVRSRFRWMTRRRRA